MTAFRTPLIPFARGSEALWFTLCEPGTQADPCIAYLATFSHHHPKSFLIADKTALTACAELWTLFLDNHASS